MLVFRMSRSKTDVGTFNATIMAIDLSSTRVVTDTGNNDNCTSDCVALSLTDYVTQETEAMQESMAHIFVPILILIVLPKELI